MSKISELIISNAIGLVLGLGTSFFSWWVLFHKIVPKIEFCPYISKIPRGKDGGFSYRIKFKNTGKRAIIDVQCTARLVVDWEGTKKNWTVAYIPLNSSGDRKTELPKVGKGGSRVLYFYLKDITTFKISHKYPDEFREKASENTITLEDILALGEKSEIKIYVTGYDEFSGSKKVFESKYFSVSDIKNGVFKDLDVVSEHSCREEQSENNA